jgi:hypothetical protein
MSGEIDYRTKAGLPSAKPKYLSDSLTPWYGNWWTSGVLTIAYDDLPPEPGVSARLIFNYAAGGYGSQGINFNTPQQLLDKKVEYWMRMTLNPTSYTTHYSHITGSEFAYVHGVIPGVWTKYSQVPVTGCTPPGGSIRSRYAIANAVYRIYEDFNIVGAYRVELAGFNIRRL